MKILLVENESDIGKLVSYVLTIQGFSVEHVFDATTAEKMLAQHSYDLILLDLMLPGEDGYSFCRRLKTMENTKSIPVVIISARVMPYEIKKGMECGAAGYITKPYDPMTLGEQIRKIYDDHRPGSSGTSAGT